MYIIKLRDRKYKSFGYFVKTHIFCIGCTALYLTEDQVFATHREARNYIKEVLKPNNHFRKDVHAISSLDSAS